MAESENTMKKDITKIQVAYDIVLDQFESGEHLDDVSWTVDDNLEDFLAIGCEPAKLASMMNPIDVLTRIELFRGIDVNSVAKRLDDIDFEVFFKQLVELGVKADSIRNLVAEWDGETIIYHIAELLKCGFSKEDLSDLLYEKVDEYNFDFSDADCLDLASTSKHLYTFLSRGRLEYIDDCVFWETIEVLLERGADKKVITEWIADHMTWQLFYEDFHEQLCKHDMFSSEDQIVGALEMGDSQSYICDWMRGNDGNPNPLFMAFMNDSENPHDLISKLNDISDCEITDYCECDCYDVTENYVRQFPNFWKSVAIIFLETYDKGKHYELYCNLRTLDWLQVDESEWRKILSGHKEWLEECIEEFKNDTDDYSMEVKLLNKLLAFAS